MRGREGVSKSNSAPVAFVTTSTASLDSSNSNRDMGDLSLQLDTLSMDLSRKKPDVEPFGPKTYEESGTSGTYLEDAIETEPRNEDTAKRRNLIRRMSSSLKKVGKSTSFRESFRSIGKTASKIRHLSFRKDNESGEASSPVDQRRKIRNRSSY